MAKNYTETLNLPKTNFSMRAGLPKAEPAVLAFWEKEKIYEKMLTKNADKPNFVLHDGPPYANGDLHMGHAMNKILKDIIVRYKNMNGYKSCLVPGWDTHGLPTELKARKMAGLKNSEDLSTAALRKLCKQCVLTYVDTQKEQFKRLGVFAKWDDPYLTLQNAYEARQIEVFSQMASSGYIYRGLRPVHWCCSCKTALAEAELEYTEDTCDSIYVKFPVKNDDGLLEKLGLKPDHTYFLIWTTTPWTLPGNVAICVGADFDYSVVQCGDENFIISTELCREVMELSGCENYKILCEIKGTNLAGIKAKHPFLERDSVVLTGGHVTVSSGTGCVHTAPGHGMEDFVVCKEHNLPTLVPVSESGHMTSEAGPFEGLTTALANTAIIEYLQKEKLLFKKHHLVHQYPHCWRCKSPVIFRATKQWFCSIDGFKEKTLDAINTVKWLPAWGKDTMSAMVKDRKDWCISRQRRWGVPFPIFYCEECGEAVAQKHLMENIAKIFEKSGSDIWYEREARTFLPEDFACPHCQSQKGFRKELDIMDVWFDSGVSHVAVCKAREGLSFPADLYLEGADQYRGWFQSSLLTAVATSGKAPYKAVLTHGLVVDAEGHKQSKSLGNGIAPQEIIDEFGADILRLWVAASDYHSDVKISRDILKQLSEAYRKIRNTARFILGNLYDFDAQKNAVPETNFLELDRWALLKLESLVEKVQSSYENFEFIKVYQAIYSFCVVDLSNFYLEVSKDRLYVETPGSLQRRSAQTAMYRILSVLTRLLAPILPYTTEEIWKCLPKQKTDEKLSVSLNDMPQSTSAPLEEKFVEKWQLIEALREDANGALEVARKDKVIGSSLEAAVKIFAPRDFCKKVGVFSGELPGLLLVSEVELLENGKGSFNGKAVPGLSVEVSRASGEKCDRCWNVSCSTTKKEGNEKLCARCASVLKDLERS